MSIVKNQLEEKLKNNLHKLSLDEVKKIMDILDSNIEKTIKKTTKKIIENKPIKIFKKDKINKIKTLKKKIINFEKKILKGGNKNIFKNIRSLNIKEKNLLFKKELKKFKNVNIEINEKEENKNTNISQKNEIIKGDYFKIKENANYFRNVIRSREYKINSSHKIVDENIFLELLKDEVIDDINNIRIELNENIKCIFVLVVKFSKKVYGEQELNDIVYFHHNHTIKKIKEQGLKS